MTSLSVCPRYNYYYFEWRLPSLKDQIRHLLLWTSWKSFCMHKLKHIITVFLKTETCSDTLTLQKHSTNSNQSLNEVTLMCWTYLDQKFTFKSSLRFQTRHVMCFLTVMLGMRRLQAIGFNNSSLMNASVSVSACGGH